MREMPAFAVLCPIECSRVSSSFPGGERSLSKRAAEEQTKINVQRVCKKKKSAGEHASYASPCITRSPIAKTPVASRSQVERGDDDDRDGKQKRRVLRDSEQRALDDE